MNNFINCPCGLPNKYQDCCGRFISGADTPTTAEQLMRSRYSAFVAEEEGYLVKTWHPATRPSQVTINPSQRWLGLSVENCTDGGPDDDTGTVEFVALFKVAGQGSRLHETSRFEKIDGSWYYRDGDHH